jgi:hypothetical protein
MLVSAGVYPVLVRSMTDGVGRSGEGTLQMVKEGAEQLVSRHTVKAYKRSVTGARKELRGYQHGSWCQGMREGNSVSVGKS